MSSRLRIVLLIALVLAALMIPVAAMAEESTDTGKATVIVANFSPDSPPVDIYINGVLLGEYLFFGEGAYPAQVNAGPVWVAIHDALAPITDPPIVDGEAILGKGEYYIIPAMNVTERAQFGAYRLPLFEPMGLNNMRVQFFHSVPEGARMDVIDVATKNKVVEAMGYVEDPVTLSNLPAGKYYWQVWTNNKVIFPGHIEDPNPPPDVLVFDMGTLNLEAGYVYSFYVVGSPKGDPAMLVLVLTMPYGGGEPGPPPVGD